MIYLNFRHLRGMDNTKLQMLLQQIGYIICFTNSFFMDLVVYERDRKARKREVCFFEIPIIYLTKRPKNMKSIKSTSIGENLLPSHTPVPSIKILKVKHTTEILSIPLNKMTMLSKLSFTYDID